MLGSYYNPYFPTPGQPRVAPGVGAYYAPANPQTPSLGTGPTYPTPDLGTFAVGALINAAAGYFVGKQLGYPMAGAAATGIFGLPGMFVLALYASSQKKKRMMGGF
jgi:hypothetical protein